MSAKTGDKSRWKLRRILTAAGGKPFDKIKPASESRSRCLHTLKSSVCLLLPLFAQKLERWWNTKTFLDLCVNQTRMHLDSVLRPTMTLINGDFRRTIVANYHGKDFNDLFFCEARGRRHTCLNSKAFFLSPPSRLESIISKYTFTSKIKVVVGVKLAACDCFLLNSKQKAPRIDVKTKTFLLTNGFAIDCGFADFRELCKTRWLLAISIIDSDSWMLNWHLTTMFVENLMTF